MGGSVYNLFGRHLDRCVTAEVRYEYLGCYYLCNSCACSCVGNCSLQKKKKKADAAEIAANAAVLAMPKTATANVKPGLRII